jgi:hypothetical protein
MIKLENKSVEKSKVVIRTIYNNIMGLEKGSWLYYQPESDSYCLNISRESTHNDIGYYHSVSTINVNISRDIVESLIGELFEYVIDAFVTSRDESSNENKLVLKK